ncbi:DUF1534 domain-containing protein [Pseudomonas syringae]|uniref:DUF1534 domain-containing protein n=1 Tax=Pseudomonas syringae TaxID=317 RepID=A0A9Q4A8P1_PSESX|nr:DUF1534 domain-containing protein [Pseudomonas syringae]MCF5474126.1 DUF1534 domain-containing protein [Pseudomonas syringae]MCF5481144.1 DUF1534 domain-containing protein [Pseudomonas syringae]MCF5488282.1 DUF1534 domain-containing protein [Pseudomonas syringae]MCF5493892.1 DUF1534 domain-containing protein [Pseudomonas syringae]
MPRARRCSSNRRSGRSFEGLSVCAGARERRHDQRSSGHLSFLTLQRGNAVLDALRPTSGSGAKPPPCAHVALPGRSVLRWRAARVCAGPSGTPVRRPRTAGR